MWPMQCPLSEQIVMIAAAALLELLPMKPPTEVKEGESGEQGSRCEEPDEGIEDPKQEVGKEPETLNPTPAEESAGRVLLNTIIDASKNLQACAIQLENSANTLSDLRADSASLQSLVSRVNYYASTTKAAQDAQSASHKQMAWDWLSASTDKTPLKDTLKSVRYQCECIAKAAYNLVETASNILEELKSQKAVMGEQCTLLKTIAANQVELSKLMKATAATEGKGQSPPSGGTPSAGATTGGSGGTAALTPGSPGMGHLPYGAYGTPSTPPPSYTPFVPPPHVAAAPIVGRFWCYQPVVAPNYEPNESRNPPSAAYASQDTPGRKAQAIQVMDDNNSIRSVSPTPHTVEQTRSMNASYVPKGWVELQSGCLHRIYG